MKSILIRDIDPEILTALKRLARNHHRSLQGELHAILEKEAKMAATQAGDNELDLVTVRTKGKSTWSREELYGNQGR